MLFMPQLIEFLKESYTVGTINVMSVLQMKKQQHGDYLDKGQLATWQRRIYGQPAQEAANQALPSLDHSSSLPICLQPRMV